VPRPAIRKVSGLGAGAEKLRDWCDRHDLGSTSGVSEFMKHGQNPRQF
jgi:hypothetical protein